MHIIGNEAAGAGWPRTTDPQDFVPGDANANQPVIAENTPASAATSNILDYFYSARACNTNYSYTQGPLKLKKLLIVPFISPLTACRIGSQTMTVWTLVNEQKSCLPLGNWGRIRCL